MQREPKSEPQAKAEKPKPEPVPVPVEKPESLSERAARAMAAMSGVPLPPKRHAR
jgi:hypothetical protein